MLRHGVLQKREKYGVLMVRDVLGVPRVWEIAGMFAMYRLQEELHHQTQSGGPGELCKRNSPPFAQRAASDGGRQHLRSRHKFNKCRRHGFSQ
ncbi:Protein of unknown function [Gryllus bimaculatus]|nr:Protein of unknown function [Gryllus bimaculatus]